MRTRITDWTKVWDRLHSNNVGAMVCKFSKQETLPRFCEPNNFLHFLLSMKKRCSVIKTSHKYTAPIKHISQIEYSAKYLLFSIQALCVFPPIFYLLHANMSRYIHVCLSISVFVGKAWMAFPPKSQGFSSLLRCRWNLKQDCDDNSVIIHCSQDWSAGITTAVQPLFPLLDVSRISAVPESTNSK